MANTKKNEIYVTELAGPDDRWLSVTDAARITRRQEKSIRDWIESGRLPVHPERVGLNKRTRQVRLSDLATLTPVVDPDAGISTDVGLLDLPSIPKTQQRLVEQMVELRELMGLLQKAAEGQISVLADKLAAFTQEMRPTWAAIGTLQKQFSWLQSRDTEQRQFIEQVREHLVERLADQVQALQQARTVLTDLVAQSDQTLRLVIHEQVSQSEERLLQALTTVSSQLLEIEQTLRNEQAGATHRLQEQLTGFAARLSEREIAHSQFQDTMAAQRDETHRRLTQIQSATETLRTNWQKQAEAAENEIRQLRRDLATQTENQQALKLQLAEERKARLALAQQVEKVLQSQQKGKGHSQVGDKEI